MVAVRFSISMQEYRPIRDRHSMDTDHRSVIYYFIIFISNTATPQVISSVSNILTETYDTGLTVMQVQVDPGAHF